MAEGCDGQTTLAFNRGQGTVTHLQQGVTAMTVRRRLPMIRRRLPNIGTDHLSAFGSVDAITAEKGKLVAKVI
jgi:hypothetical protein